MFLTAKQIHNGHGWLPEGSVIELSDEGIILSVKDGPAEGAIFYEGILAPGFVNAHCHLELSHLKGMVEEHTGLIPFLRKIPLHRNDFTDEQKKRARHDALKELVNNGISAVGDISNTTDTLDLRALSALHFHTFIEAIGFIEARAATSFGFAEKTFEDFTKQGKANKWLSQSVTPHAPYSVSKSLFGLIGAHQAGSILSIHSQESEEENKFYIHKEGAVRDLLHGLGIDDSLFEPTGQPSLQSWPSWISTEHPLILVHNTYSKKEDIAFVLDRFKDVHWCLCPNANLYIENKLPDIPLLINEGVNICIGTDSLASNNRLCILSELDTIKENFPQINWETLLTWGTRNGARALNMDSFTGTLEPGKQPGIIHITGLDSGKPSVVRVGI